MKKRKRFLRWALWLYFYYHYKRTFPALEKKDKFGYKSNLVRGGKYFAFLVLYSDADFVSPVEQVELFWHDLQDREGYKIYMHKFADAQHMACLKTYASEYTSVVSNFVQECATSQWKFLKQKETAFLPSKL